MSGTDAKTGTADYLTNFMNLKSITEDLNSYEEPDLKKDRESECV